jgi:hypothetical protein
MQVYAQDVQASLTNSSAPYDFSLNPNLHRVASGDNFFFYHSIGNVVRYHNPKPVLFPRGPLRSSVSRAGSAFPTTITRPMLSCAPPAPTCTPPHACSSRIEKV